MSNSKIVRALSMIAYGVATIPDSVLARFDQNIISEDEKKRELESVETLLDGLAIAIGVITSTKKEIESIISVLVDAPEKTMGNTASAIAEHFLHAGKTVMAESIRDLMKN